MTVTCNGLPVQLADVLPALVNYGHFTSLQVRGGRVQGLALHLQRLAGATAELFGTALDTVTVQAWIAQALCAAGQADASVRVTVYARGFDFRDPLAPVPVDVLVAVSAPVTLHAACRVRSVRYQRELPHLKHMGTFGLFAQRRLARAAGFDDAVFVSEAGALTEGTTWNLALHDGVALIWPQGPALAGTAQALLQAHWPGPQQQRVVGCDELPAMRAGFACNASGVWPLSAIDDHALAGSDALAAQARAVLAGVPGQPLAGPG